MIEFCYISQCELKLSGSSNPYVSAVGVSGMIGTYHTAGIVKHPCLCLGFQSIHFETVLSFTVWLLKYIVSHWASSVSGQSLKSDLSSCSPSVCASLERLVCAWEQALDPHCASTWSWFSHPSEIFPNLTCMRELGLIVYQCGTLKLFVLYHSGLSFWILGCIGRKLSKP